MGFPSVGKVIAWAVFAIWANRMYSLLGFKRGATDTIDKHFEDFECSQILESLGAEDIATTADGLAFITSGLMYPPFSFTPKVGKIYVADLEESPVRLIEATIICDHDLMLNPHGIDLIEVDADIFIYVVNHKTDLSEESVEKFEYNIDTNQLVWLKSFTSSSLRSINDLVLVGEDEFYATNDHYFSLRQPLLRNLETYLNIYIGSVVHCKEASCSITGSHNLAMPNGITSRKVIHDTTGDLTTEILVVYCYGMGVGVYHMGETGNLVYIRTIPTPAGMDNLWVTPDSTTYLTGHPLAWKFLLAVWKPDMAKDYPPASEVLRMDEDTYEFNQVYLDNGFQFSGSSIAVFWKDNILLGSPTGNLMECHRIK